MQDETQKHVDNVLVTISQSPFNAEDIKKAAEPLKQSQEGLEAIENKLLQPADSGNKEILTYETGSNIFSFLVIEEVKNSPDQDALEKPLTPEVMYKTFGIVIDIMRELGMEGRPAEIGRQLLQIRQQCLREAKNGEKIFDIQSTQTIISGLEEVLGIKEPDIIRENNTKLGNYQTGLLKYLQRIK